MTVTAESSAFPVAVDLHLPGPHVPTSAAPLLVRDWRTIAALAGIVAALAVVAHWADPTLVRLFDHPVEQWVIDHRSPALDWVFRRASFIGSSEVVYTLGPLLGR